MKRQTNRWCNATKISLLSLSLPVLLASATSANIVNSAGHQSQSQGILSESQLEFQISQGSNICYQVIAEHGMYVREEPTVYSEAIAIINYGQPVAIAPLSPEDRTPNSTPIPGFIWPNVAENWTPISAPIPGYVWTDWLTPCQS